MDVLLWLCLEFFCTGLFAVGGGLATIPFLQRMGHKHPTWFTQAQLADTIAVSQCAPGPMGTNIAATVGYRVRQLPGAVLSVLSLMVPTVVIDLVIAALFDKFRRAKRVREVLATLRPASAGLILAAALSLLLLSLSGGQEVPSLRSPAGWRALAEMLDWRCLALYTGLLPFAFWKKLNKVHPLAYVAAGAVAGVLWKL
ncbi:MAG: chromate transporter [Oscillospiraceae bacterium]|jgi:chromate transporter|nr:chromate transporter [Oscillospiraceae bacterium]